MKQKGEVQRVLVRVLGESYSPEPFKPQDPHTNSPD